MKTLTSILISLPFFFISDLTSISTKSIESKMVEVNEGFFVNKYETTNLEYRTFLEWAKENNETKILEASEIHNDGWSGVMDATYFENYAANRGYDEHPVVNITQEGARNFCNWLTKQYNSTKKRKYKKVKFRLPTKAEWVNIATSGRSPAPAYPWGSPYVQNSKGHYLANFFRIGQSRMKVDIQDRTSVEISGIEDHKPFLIPDKVQSFPQGVHQIHNLSGNAAEMVAEEGSTKGGSWGSSGYYLRIDAEDEFEGFDYSPYVGFRYVMEVIEK